MAIINDDVKERVKKHNVEVFFVSGAVCKWWNARRTDKRNEICLLGGYYWVADGIEMGPFRTPSAAHRDAFYRQVLKQEPPLMDQHEVAAALGELKEQDRRSRRKAASRSVGKRARVENGKLFLNQPGT